MLFNENHEVRRVRMNEPHPAKVNRPGMGMPSAITRAIRWWSTPWASGPIVRSP